jgi:hypothetical protein
MANTKITNRVLDKTVITGQSAVTVADGDYILVADASDSSALKKVLASDLIQSSEEVADIVGAMVSSNTESGITVAYQDADNTIDFTVGTLNQNTTGSAATLTTARTIGGTSFDGSANIAVGLAATATALATSRTIHGVGFDGSANIDLSEVISDTVGAMFSSNTETNITATYQDSDNTIDLVVDAAQPNVTSLGTLTTLDVDNINFNGNTIKSTDSDGDLIFQGNDGGSTITALTLDMSDAGSAIFNHDAVFADNGRVLLGSSSDLQLVHDGSNSYIDDAGTGILYVRGNNKIILGKYTGETMVEANVDGAVELYYDNAKKLETTSTGITVTGSNSVDGYIGQFTQANTSNGDGVKVQIGSAAASEYAFDVRSNAGSTQIISAKGDGKVGIGVASPVTGLTVASSTNITQQPLATSGTTISWNALTHANAYLVPAANLTIDLPTNPIEGAIISVEIAMNGTPRTIAWHTVFEFAASTAPTATATANKTDIFTFRYNGAVWQEIGRVQNMAQT